MNKTAELLLSKTDSDLTGASPNVIVEVMNKSQSEQTAFHWWAVKLQGGGWWHRAETTAGRGSGYQTNVFNTGCIWTTQNGAQGGLQRAQRKRLDGEIVDVTVRLAS